VSVVVFTFLLFSQVMLGQTAQRSAAPAAGMTTANELSGIWAPKVDPGAIGMDGGAAVLAFTQELPSMTAWAKGKYDVIRKGTNGPFERTSDQQDPHIHCLPYGMPRIFAVNEPFEIVQVPGRVLMLFEADHMVRRIYTDGRKPSEDAEPTYMGHATGTWERNTLVVETVGLNDLTWIDSIGHPHSDALRITERIRRVNHNTLEIKFLFTDPKAYLKPWGGTKLFELKPDWEISEELTCEDHLRDYHIPKLLKGEPEEAHR